MAHVRYTDQEIAELCQIPPWTNSALDQQTKQIHDAVPLTRKVIVDQCLFWTDVAHRFKRNMCPRKITDVGDPTEASFTVGVIGCGSVGSKFVRELLKRELVAPSQIKISSRTPSRAKQRCGLEVVANNIEVAQSCSILLLFVLPYHFRNFSREIRETIQKTKPLIVSTLAGFTQQYLQRALSTQFLITTSVHIPTVQAGASHLSEDFPLVSYVVGDEIQYLHENLLGPDELAGLEPEPVTEPETAPEPKPEGEAAPAPAEGAAAPEGGEPRPAEPPAAEPESQPAPKPEPEAAPAVPAEPVPAPAPVPAETASAPASEPPPGTEPETERAPGTSRTAGTERSDFGDVKTKRRIHQAAFSAENFIKLGLAGVKTSVVALRDWVALDPNHGRIQQRPETYARLWSRSFLPLPLADRIDKADSNAVGLIGNVLKRSFVRSLIGAKPKETVE